MNTPKKRRNTEKYKYYLNDVLKAREHIRIACEIEPYNQTYQNLKTQMENMYYQRKTTKRYKFSFGRLLFSLFKFYIVINNYLYYNKGAENNGRLVCSYYFICNGSYNIHFF